jgi:inorganic phosphate transporter, PiT family
MDVAFALKAITLLLGFYMAWNIGANDVANAMGTSVGSKALSLKKAVFLAAILEFSGAFFVGSNVSVTIQKGIVDPVIFQSDPLIFVIGMMGSLLATGILLQFASYFGLPISTTHAIVGAVLGFGAVIGGVGAVHWSEVAWIVSSWILSPLVSGVVAYLIFLLIQKKILFALDPVEATRRLAPFFVFMCFNVVVLSLCYHGLAQADLDFPFSYAFSISCVISLAAAFLSHKFIMNRPAPSLLMESGFHPAQAVSLEKALHHMQRVHLSNRSNDHAIRISRILDEVRSLSDDVKKEAPFHDSTAQYHGVEKTFVFLQILSACLVAFAHGANDVANAIGPVAAVLGVLKTNSIASHSAIPAWLLVLGGAGIVIGLATWGWRVIETIGSKITELTPTRGFAAELGAAVTILFASKLGMPISTTHALVGAVFGVGMARGLKALNLQTLKEIVVSWIVTIPLCATLSIILFYLLKWILL